MRHFYYVCFGFHEFDDYRPIARKRADGISKTQPARCHFLDYRKSADDGA